MSKSKSFPWMLHLLAALLTASSAAMAAVEPSGAVAAAAPAGPAAVDEVDWTFAQLGASGPLQLRGVDGQSGVSFGIRLDQVVMRARLKLRFTYSPAMLQDLSHLKLVLNNEVIDTIPLPKDKAGKEIEYALDIDPRYFTDFNHLDIHLIGHYTMECEDTMHSSLWASISNRSSLELTLRELGLQDDLSLLPAPFFDRRDNRRLELPFVFAGAPGKDVLQAAGVLASWFGAQASYRSARFPVFLDKLPQQHAVVFATNADKPAWLKLEPVQAPTLSIIGHPLDPAVKLLLVQGKDAAQLRTAADALVLGRVAMTGASATVTKVEADPPRAAYDAPNWVRTDRPVKFGELVGSPGELQAVGHAPPPVRVNVRVPPDLLTWNRLGVPIELHYRYTPPVEQDNSLLTIAINDQFVQSFRLRPSGKTSTQGRILVPLLEEGAAQLEDEVVIPAFQVGSNNQLQFQFVTDMHKQGLCKDTASDVVRAAIDPDSTIDLTPFPHYAAMPNLALFANAGFPFTKYADLAETFVVMPSAPQASDIEAMMFMLGRMGRMGRMTGVPALRFTVGGTDEALKAGDKDLLVIGGPSGKDLLAQWGKSLPALIEESRRRVSAADAIGGFPRDLLDKPRDPARAWQVEVDAKGELAAIMGFESPLRSGRSVVAVAASRAAAVGGALDALENEGLVGNIHGDIAFVDDRHIESFQIADSYHVGHLPLWLALRFHLSRYPLLLALGGILAGLLLALAAYWQLKRVAARRLDP